MKFALALLACAISAFGSDCISSPCSFSTNISWDAKGEADSRPQTWGTTAYVDSSIAFKNVPAGMRVRIVRVYGDHVAFAHGAVIPGTFAGVSLGLLNSTPFQSPFVADGLGSSGTMLYLQHVVGSSESRAAFDVRTRPSGLLNADNLLIVRQAVWLNETGASIHMEVSMVVEFCYETP